MHAHACAQARTQTSMHGRRQTQTKMHGADARMKTRTKTRTHGRRRGRTDDNADARMKTRTHGHTRGRTDAHAAARDLTQTQANADVSALHAWAIKSSGRVWTLDDRSRTFEMYYRCHGLIRLRFRLCLSSFVSLCTARS